MKFEDREQTELALDSLFSYDFEDDLPGLEDIEQFDDVMLFKEAILKRIAELGFEGESDSDIVSFLLGLCKDHGADISRQTLSNWICESAPSGGAQSRNNVYRLCFALDFDENRTAEFFLKAYLEKPFNFKDVGECVYYYCLKNKLPYGDAVRIIKTINELPESDNGAFETNTVFIERNVTEITNERKLIDYIAANRAGFKEQGTRARVKLNELLRKCYEIAQQESDLYPGQFNVNKVNNPDALLKVIYDYDARKMRYDKKISISKSNFPRAIKRNFPQRQQIEDIIKGRGSFDSIRKALVVLEFYHYYGDALINGAQGDFDEFTDEMNSILQDTGYIQLYWRNPFDWMFGYCAVSNEPMYTFRDLIEEFYLSNDSE